MKLTPPGPTFNPLNQYGNYIELSMPDAPKDVIAEARRVLQNQVDLLIPTELLVFGKLEWFIDPEFRLEDPETGEVRIVTAVGWKWTPNDIRG